MYKYVPFFAILAATLSCCHSAPVPAAELDNQFSSDTTTFISELQKQNVFTICSTVQFAYEIGDENSYLAALIALDRSGHDPKEKECFEGSQYGTILANKAKFEYKFSHKGK